jgi:hypothetical protein
VHGQGIDRTRDAGGTWVEGFSPDYQAVGNVVGGSGAQPNRFYLAGLKVEGLGATLYRSDDDTQTWSPVGSFARIDNAVGSTITGLAYDPGNSDLVFVALMHLRGARLSPENPPQVLASEDGGATWQDLAQGQLGPINDLALGIDGQTLFAATDQGVVRVPLTAL